MMNHINASCMDKAFGAGAYLWLNDQLSLNRIGIDQDVMNRPEWDYASGYWVPSSLRYQYDNKPIFVAEQIVNEDSYRDIAETLVHETGHEFGLTSADEGLAEAIGRMCTH
jgi:hypothetical protein